MLAFLLRNIWMAPCEKSSQYPMVSTLYRDPLVKYKGSKIQRFNTGEGYFLYTLPPISRESLGPFKKYMRIELGGPLPRVLSELVLI